MKTELNLFEKFEGTDLDRLVSCIEAIKKAGLGINKYCQAGINSNSGNVYIYSDDWPGCIYCSLNFNLAWSYCCSECGQEYDFKTYSELCEYSDKCNKNDQKCESCGDCGKS